MKSTILIILAALSLSSCSKPQPIPYATLDPADKGYARSPYAPTQGLIDLRTIPRDQQVRCPYTGKLLLAPGPGERH